MSAPTTEPPTTDEAVLLSRRGAALWLRLNRPAALNGISPEIIAGLHRGLDMAQADPDIRAVVIAAEGRIFCAGADLKHVNSLINGEQGDAPHSPQQLFLREVGNAYDRVEAFSKPVIAAVHGLAIAGGLELVLCCDLVVAARGAKFGDAHSNYGLLPGAGGSIRLPRRIGLARAKQLMYTGASYPPEFFAGTDLVNSIVDDDKLVDEVDQLVKTIATKSPVGLARMKQLVHDGLEVPQAVGLRMEVDVSALHEKSSDFVEGLAAFNAKRTPKFVGR